MTEADRAAWERIRQAVAELASTDPHWLSLYLRGAAQSLEMMVRTAGSPRARPSPVERMLVSQRARTQQRNPVEKV